ncbi:MAG TPA: hypothetical protein VJQ46_12655 [Gemmatimonadales bacterium]|nr:hypothetical protein [Gemmatimonadales bacterium]
MATFLGHFRHCAPAFGYPSIGVRSSHLNPAKDAWWDFLTRRRLDSTRVLDGAA